MSQRYNFPKVELHCHLDGCARLETVIEIAKRRKISLPTYDSNDLKDFITVQKRMTLKEYLERFHILLPVLAGDEDALIRTTKEAVEDRKADGVVYVELRYSPQLLANCDVEPAFFHKEKGRMRPKDVVEIVSKAARDAEEEFGVKVRTILCDIAEHSGWGLQTAQLCYEYGNQGVVAMDIANMHDAGHYFGESLKAFQYCKDHGIHRTAHAGEVGDANQVKLAVEQMDVERIGHGYHVVDDEDVYKYCKEHGTHFEVCPLSSFLTGSVPEDWSLHPAKRFLGDDVNFSLNTDDPGVQLTNLLDDYDIAVKHWGFTEKDLQKLNLNAARSCFMDDGNRRDLIKSLKKAYGISDDAI